MNFLTNVTGLTVYRVFLILICNVSLLVWTVAIKILGIIFALFLPGIINEFIDDPLIKRRASDRYIAPYQLFLFIWNGSRVKKARASDG